MARVFSQEDGNLSKRPITTSRTVSYKDVDLTFAKKGSGDIFKKEDAASVKQAVKNILLTNPGEKPFNPSFGGGLNRFLFNLDTDFDPYEIQDAVRFAIARDEPRARVRGVKATVNPDQNSIQVRVAFQVINTTVTEEVTVDLTRLR